MRIGFDGEEKSGRRRKNSENSGPLSSTIVMPVNPLECCPLVPVSQRFTSVFQDGGGQIEN